MSVKPAPGDAVRVYQPGYSSREFTRQVFVLRVHDHGIEAYELRADGADVEVRFYTWARIYKGSKNP